MKETPKCRPNLHDIFRFRGRPDRGQLQGVGTKPRPRRHGESRNGSLRAHDRLVVHQATADQLRIARSGGRPVTSQWSTEGASGREGGGRTRIDGRMMMSVRKRGEGRMTVLVLVTTVHNPSSVSKSDCSAKREIRVYVCVTKMMLGQAIARPTDRPTGPECCPQRRVVRWCHSRLTTLMGGLASTLSPLSLSQSHLSSPRPLPNCKEEKIHGPFE